MLAPPALSGFSTLLQPTESAAEAVIRCGGAGAGCANAANGVRIRRKATAPSAARTRFAR